MAMVLREAHARRGSNKNSDDDRVMKRRAFKDQKREKSQSNARVACGGDMVWPGLMCHIISLTKKKPRSGNQ